MKNDSVATSYLEKRRREIIAERERLFDVPMPQGIFQYSWGIMKQYACCPKAKFVTCVCSYAFYCDDHGQTHVGTHD